MPLIALNNGVWCQWLATVSAITNVCFHQISSLIDSFMFALKKEEKEEDLIS